MVMNTRRKFRILGRADPGVVQIEGVIVTLDRRYVDIHELHRFVGRIVDCMRVPHPAGRADSSLQNGGSSVNGEFRFAVEDHEHLFIGVVEVMANTAAGHDLTPMHEVQIDVQ